MKIYILFFFSVFVSFTVKAQGVYNYQELGVGFDASYIRGYTNIQRQYNHAAFDVNVMYNYNPYLPIVAEIQVGQLSGGGATKALDPFERFYVNNYKAFIIHSDVMLGATIDYENGGILNIIKNIYFGTGIGLLYNDNTVNRHAADNPTYTFPGKNTGINVVIPLRFGYEFKIYDSYDEPSMAIDIGYVHSFAFGEGLDGYDDPSSIFKNNASDQYRQITIGFKYFFGNIVSYNKVIRVFN